MVAAPAMTTMAIAAPHFVRGLYGPQWIGVVAPLQVLSFAGYFRALYHLGGITAQSLGRIYGELWRQVVYAALVIGGVLVGSRYGLTGVAIGVSSRDSVHVRGDGSPRVAGHGHALARVLERPGRVPS